MDIVYRPIEFSETEIGLFSSFERKQNVTDCWRKIEGKWRIVNAPFTDDWNENDYIVLTESLKNTVKAGGLVYGAFVDGRLKGFVSVDGARSGRKGSTRILCTSMFRGICGGGESAAGCSGRRKSMPEKSVLKSCIFRRIRRSKHKRFIKLWGASKRRNIRKNTLKKSRLTVSSNVL